MLMTDWSQFVWFGLIISEADGQYEWTDGTKLDYTNWGVGQPYTQLLCSFICSDKYNINNSGVWYKKWVSNGAGDCSASLRAFVCKKPAYF